MMLSVLKLPFRRASSINSSTTNSKTKPRAAQGFIQTKNCLKSHGCFPREDDREGRDVSDVDEQPVKVCEPIKQKKLIG